MASTPRVGAPAPSLSLPGTRLVDGHSRRETYTLSEHRGAPLVLAFYPGDNTPVCTRQMCSYSTGLEAFTELGADVWAISGQGIDSHEGFASKHALTMPLLADTDGAAAAAYGLGLLSGRSTFIVDGDGVLRWKDTRAGLTYVRPATLTAALRDLAAV